MCEREAETAFHALYINIMGKIHEEDFNRFFITSNLMDDECVVWK